MILLALADPPTRDEIRRRAGEIFGRDEFVQRKGFLQRILDWLQDRMPEREVTGQAPGGFTALGNLLLYLLLAALVALVLFVVWRVVRNWQRRPELDEEDEEAEFDVTVERTTKEWRGEAERAEAEGRSKEAIRARYRELVGELVDRRVLPAIPGRTTGELRFDLARVVPGAAPAFDEATMLFELPWYANAPTGPDEHARFRQVAAEVLDICQRVEVPDVTELVDA